MQKNKTIIISAYAPYECKSALSGMGYTVFDGAVLPDVDPAVAHHIDMQLVKCSESTFICAPCVYEHYRQIFLNSNYSLIPGDKNPEGKYPYDIRYNVAVAGKYAIHNTLHTDHAFAENSEYISIGVNQGYAKCNICVVSDDAIITSDRGIANTLSRYPLDVLLIRAGYIRLAGYDYGFIGGSSGLLENKLLAFAGDVTLHPDFELIKSFCSNRGVEVASLYKGELVDIGTIISLG